LRRCQSPERVEERQEDSRDGLVVDENSSRVACDGTRGRRREDVANGGVVVFLAVRSEGVEMIQVVLVVCPESELAEHEEMATTPVREDRGRRVSAGSMNRGEGSHQAMSEAFLELSPARERPLET
jgi:hypothetical protein